MFLTGNIEIAPSESRPTIDLPSHLERMEERMASGEFPRAGDTGVK